jgi:hypothetical protein
LLIKKRIRSFCFYQRIWLLTVKQLLTNHDLEKSSKWTVFYKQSVLTSRKKLAHEFLSSLPCHRAVDSPSYFRWFNATTQVFTMNIGRLIVIVIFYSFSLLYLFSLTTYGILLFCVDNQSRPIRFIVVSHLIIQNKTPIVHKIHQHGLLRPKFMKILGMMSLFSFLG